MEIRHEGSYKYTRYQSAIHTTDNIHTDKSNINTRYGTQVHHQACEIASNSTHLANASNHAVMLILIALRHKLVSRKAGRLLVEKHVHEVLPLEFVDRLEFNVCNVTKYDEAFNGAGPVQKNTGADISKLANKLASNV